MDKLIALMIKLESKWKLARKERLLWRNSNPYSFNFNHYEYQRLWEIEIGAEMNYIITSGRLVSISWYEYCAERDKYFYENPQ